MELASSHVEKTLLRAVLEVKGYIVLTPSLAKLHERVWIAHTFYEDKKVIIIVVKLEIKKILDNISCHEHFKSCKCKTFSQDGFVELHKGLDKVYC